MGINPWAFFAAGCPVVVKGHPAHPGTGELVARAIRAAVQACGLAEGVFSFLPGHSNELGAALVHFFDTASLSFSDGIRTEPGDVFEITADAFLLPVRNPLADEQLVAVRVL